VELFIPPIREREEDIPLLLQHFLEKYNNNRDQPLHLSQEVFECLERYSWPGNIRELDNLVRKLTVICENPEVTIEDLPQKLRNTRTDLISSPEFKTASHDFKTALNRVISEFEKSFLQHHLDSNLGNISKCAATIGISRVALHQKIKQYQLRIS
jgi:DNA-binding NtrC family response regulator